AGEGSGDRVGWPGGEVALEETLGELVEALRQEPLCQGTRLPQDVRNLLYAASLVQRARPMLDAFCPDLLYERYCLLGIGGLALPRELAEPLLMGINSPTVLCKHKL